MRQEVEGRVIHQQRYLRWYDHCTIYVYRVSVVISKAVSFLFNRVSKSTRRLCVDDWYCCTEKWSQLVLLAQGKKFWISRNRSSKRSGQAEAWCKCVTKWGVNKHTTTPIVARFTTTFFYQKNKSRNIHIDAVLTRESINILHEARKHQKLWRQEPPMARFSLMSSTKERSPGRFFKTPDGQYRQRGTYMGTFSSRCCG